MIMCKKDLPTSTATLRLNRSLAFRLGLLVWPWHHIVAEISYRYWCQQRLVIGRRLEYLASWITGKRRFYLDRVIQNARQTMSVSLLFPADASGCQPRCLSLQDLPWCSHKKARGQCWRCEICCLLESRSRQSHCWVSMLVSCTMHSFRQISILKFWGNYHL